MKRAQTASGVLTALTALVMSACGPKTSHPRIVRLDFRLDYTGIFPPNESRTTHCEPGAKIQGIMIANRP